MEKKDLLKIKSFDSLVEFLVDELEWPIDIDDLTEEEYTFSYTAEEIGLSEEHTAKLKEIKQLRSFSPNQPWAVFWMDFETKKLPISVLRRILRHFVEKKRATDPNQVTWKMEDILFISGHGEELLRGMTVAHFKTLDGKEVMREFSWDAKEQSFDNYIAYLNKLKWSEDFQSDVSAWKAQWRLAFTGSTREAVRTSKQLAVAMANMAKDIRDRVSEVYHIERKKGPLHKLYNSFKEGLIHDMTVDQFADMYAQTMTYGLFSARTMDTDGQFEMHEVADLIPATNPFLKKLFKECLDVGTDHSYIDLDELGVGSLVDLLDGLNKSDGTDVMTRILEEFGRRTGSGNEDPVIHFYEEFLKEYDQIERVKKGVYYTPDPVVDFIVRSVNEQLKTEFGLEMGLADTTTWDEMVASGRAEWPKDPATGKVNKFFKEKLSKRAFVQILDPATGTGTFLIRAITEIHSEVKAKHKRDRIATPWQAYWNEYVDKELFPRLYGFELMMASYSVAHMRIGMHLKSLGYEFKKDQRLNVYLTNTLESPNEMGSGDLFYSSIGSESAAAKLTKEDRYFSVVIGNPPYNGSSKNKGNWIMSIMKDYKMEPGGKEKLRERNPKWINDDYVKFLRYGQHNIEENRSGILAFINPHGFLDNPTFRGMRWHLLKTYGKINTIDLHGNSKKNETCPDGSPDVNVFDIMQGVSINLFVKTGKKKTNELGKVLHYDLFGKRDFKYDFLTTNSILTIDFKELPKKAPNYFMVQKDFELEDLYNKGFELHNLFLLKSLGIQTHRDNFAIAFTQEKIKNRIKDFFNPDLSNEELISQYQLRETKEWQLDKYRNDTFNLSNIRKIDYRFFDTRYTYYSRNVIDRDRRNVMQHLLNDNIAITLSKQLSIVGYQHIFLSKNIQESCLISLKTKEGGYSVPLYLYPEGNGQQTIEQSEERKPNLNEEIVNEIAKKLSLSFTDEKEGTANTFAPIDILDYIYAVLHSPTYREKYKEFLKIDFPSVPFPKDAATFWKLVRLGSELREIHLMESEEVNSFITEFPVLGTNEVTKSMTAKSPGWMASEENSEIGDVWINDDQYFTGVPKIAWEFYIGGYQPAQKWLKDRKGRNLNNEDIEHYQKIIVALTKTARIMKEIDEIEID